MSHEIGGRMVYGFYRTTSIDFRRAEYDFGEVSQAVDASLDQDDGPDLGVDVTDLRGR